MMREKNAYFVESDDEGSLLVPEQLERLESLGLETVLDKGKRTRDQPLKSWIKFKAKKRELTIRSTTRMAMLQSEDPRVRRLLNDSWPGVSMIRRPGILYSFLPSCRIGSNHTQYRKEGGQEGRIQLLSRKRRFGTKLKGKEGSTDLVENLGLGLDGLNREIGGSDLLGNTTSLTLLDVSLPDLQTEDKENKQDTVSLSLT
jgi:hypothetical protein